MKLFENEVQSIDGFLNAYFSRREESAAKELKTLFKSMRYSLFSGGKRFRPALTLITGEMLDVSQEKLLPYACAVEFIHTYSLIHDDLPSMDNDDERRGQPTNHKAFDEGTALLAGDALLTEAFYMISEAYEKEAPIGLSLTKELSGSAGMLGMIGGQVMDIDFLSQGALYKADLDTLKKMQAKKTGELIKCSVTGAGILAGLDKDKMKTLCEFGELLGLSFQLADDIHDFDPDQPEASGFPKWIGLGETKKLLQETSIEAQKKLMPFGERALRLKSLIEFNLSRKS